MKMQNIYQGNKVEIILYILGINFIIALTYLIVKWIKKDLSCGIIMSIFMIICPLVAPLYLFLSWFVYEIYFKRRKMDISIGELSFRKDKIKVILKPDMLSALNTVSLEEAFIVSDKKSARKLLLDVLREDSSGSLKTILKAVEHRDSEVSHYAASAISDIISEFKIKERQLRKKYSKDKGNVDLCNEYVDYLNNFLSQKILSTAEQRLYSGIFEELIKTIEEYLPSKISGELYNKIVCILLDLGENDKAKVWAQKALINNENELESYKAGLRYYYINKDRSEFLSLLEKLKKSDVLLDHDILEMVRFFSH
jgi:tetratricopeptide (TPR) repeat protein